MTGIALLVDRSAGWPGARQILDYSAIGVLLLAVGNGLVMWSERFIPSGIAALIVATVPLWLTFFDGLRPGGQAWTGRVWAGTVVGLVGVVFVARPEGGVAPGHWPGILALQLASLSWTAGSLYSQALRRRVPLVSASAIEMLAGGLVLSLQSLLVREDLGPFLSAPPRAWLGILYLVVFGSLIGFTAFAYCLNELPASIVGTYAYVNPVVAVALGRFFLGEPLSAGLVAGGLLILAAVLLSTSGRRPVAASPPRPSEPVTEG